MTRCGLRGTTSPTWTWEQRQPLTAARLAEIRQAMGFRLRKYADRLAQLHGPPDPGPFPQAVGKREQDWKTVDLSGVLNRPLTGTDGWIGMPFETLPVGRSLFAGIPFSVADPAQHGGRGALALRSATITKTLGEDVPASVEVPIGERADCVYILHGAGWVKEHGQIGRYELLFEDGETAALPVVAYGPETALVLALAEMYVQGVSTRKVKAVTEALCGHSFSASSISRMTAKLDAELAAFMSRPLEEAYPYLILDARYEKVREGGVIRSQAVLIAIGINWDGRRCVLAVERANRESHSSWRDFLVAQEER